MAEHMSIESPSPLAPAAPSGSTPRPAPGLLDHSLRPVAGSVLLLILLLLPPVAQALGDDFYVGVASRVLVFALAATSLNLILGFGGMVSFGHAAFVGMGAYAAGIAMNAGWMSAWATWPLTTPNVKIGPTT